MGRALTRRRERRRAPGNAGVLLPVSALSEEGVLLRTDGAVVRYLEVLPPNPLVLDPSGCERLTAGFSAVLSRLAAGQGAQFYVEARPLAFETVRDAYLEDVERALGALEATAAARDSVRALGRLSETHVESLEHHAADHAAVDLRHVVVLPYRPVAPRWAARARPAGWDASAGHLHAATQSLALADAVRSELEALDVGASLMDGRQVAALIARRFSDVASGPPDPAPLGWLGGDGHGAAAADQAGRRLRAALCPAVLDASDRRWLEVGRDVEQTLYLAGAPEATFLGWLLHAMQSPRPWTLSVHVQALDRALERRRYKQRYRRLYGVNRGAEASGHVPDLDQSDHEGEVAELLAELSGSATAGLYELSVYQSLRAPGPVADTGALARAVEQQLAAVSHAVDARMLRGEFAQLDLWRSTLPVGLDVARRAWRCAATNAADTLPLVGTSCGSPRGLHLGYAEPGRTLERLDPFDALHDNGTLIVNGKSGAGKTFLVQALLQQALALGARCAVIDRSAGHYAFLCSLIDGARHVAIGGEDAHTVNPWDAEDTGAVAGAKVAFLVRLHALLIGDHHADADAFGLAPLERNLLELAIRGVYSDAAITGQVPCESYLREQLTERAVAEAKAPEGSPEVAATYRSLAERLHAFCGEGSYGYLLDRPTTVDLGTAPLAVFDTRGVPEEVSPAVLFVLSEFITGHIERRREAHLRSEEAGEGGPFAGRFVLVLEELWKLTERRATGMWLNEQARRARHAGLFLVCVTQQRSDLAGPWGKALLDNSTLQLLLRQSPDELAYLRDALKLSDAEVELVAHLKTDKRRAAQAYFINGTRGRGVVSVRLGPRAYWIATSDPIEDVPARERALRAAGRDPWVALDLLVKAGGDAGAAA